MVGNYILYVCQGLWLHSLVDFSGVSHHICLGSSENKVALQIIDCVVVASHSFILNLVSQVSLLLIVAISDSWG